MTETMLFASSFVTVFALGLQSLNVNGGHYLAAFVTSFAIGTGNLFILKLVPGDTSAIALAAYLAGGPLGIVCSMWCHRHTLGRRRRGPPRAFNDNGPAPYERPEPPPCPPRPHNSVKWLTESERRTITRRAAESLNVNSGADRP